MSDEEEKSNVVSLKLVSTNDGGVRGDGKVRNDERDEESVTLKAQREDAVQSIVQWAKSMEDGHFDAVHICGISGTGGSRSETVVVGDIDGYTILGILRLAEKKLLDDHFEWRPDE